LEEIIANWMDTYFISQYAGSKTSTLKICESEEVRRESNCL
ncbi:alpha/beta hydrolase, partial [Bacillus cereus group sp. Bce037]